jgi:hypothetical protein
MFPYKLRVVKYFTDHILCLVFPACQIECVKADFLLSAVIKEGYKMKPQPAFRVTGRNRGNQWVPFPVLRALHSKTEEKCPVSLHKKYTIRLFS